MNGCIRSDCAATRRNTCGGRFTWYSKIRQKQNILGKTATLEFHMVDADHDARNVLGGAIPADAKVFDYEGRPILLKNETILRGSSITSARSSFGEDGRASVEVRLGGGGESLFTKTTAENIGKPMAVVYVETKSEVKDVNGQKVINYKTERRVISVATIQNALGNSFQITGLTSQEESRRLALLLRAGALPAPVTYIEERRQGPSLENKIFTWVPCRLQSVLLLSSFLWRLLWCDGTHC